MGSEINLMFKYTKAKRDVASRSNNNTKGINISLNRNYYTYE